MHVPSSPSLGAHLTSTVVRKTGHLMLERVMYLDRAYSSASSSLQRVSARDHSLCEGGLPRPPPST